MVSARLINPAHRANQPVGAGLNWGRQSCRIARGFDAASRLRTLLGLSVVVAILLGWWKYEHDNPAVLLGDLAIFLVNLPMLALLQFPWYVYVPILFGLGCGIYMIGWISGKMIERTITVIHHVAMPKMW